MISKLLKKNAGEGNVQKELEDLFSRPIKKIEVEQEKEKEQIDHEAEQELEQEGDEELSAVQIKERNERTVFVGNVDLDLEKKHLLKHFKPIGKIEKVWFRSVPVEQGNLPTKAAVILKKYAKDATGKNAYILFSTKEEAEAALQLNNTVIKTNHLRVNPAVKKFDFEKTLFIGNLPFITNEEELRTFFTECGEIQNIRVIRDHQTHAGKGIAYVTFKDLAGFKKALKKPDLTFNGRELRIKKASPTERVEKKKSGKKSDTRNNAERRLKRKEAREERKDDLKPKDMKALLDNADIRDKTVEEMNLENEIKSSPALLRKRIGKLHRKTGEDKFNLTLQETKRAKDKNKKEIFNGVNERKERKEKLKKKAMLNKKQFNRQRVLLKSK